MEKDSLPDWDISAQRVPLLYSILTLCLHVNWDIPASQVPQLLTRGTCLTELCFYHVQYRPEVRLCDSRVCVTRMTPRLACKICRIFITSQLDSKCFESKIHCTITKLTRATRKTRVWFYMHPDPVHCTCMWLSMRKSSKAGWTRSSSSN